MAGPRTQNIGTIFIIYGFSILKFLKFVPEFECRTGLRPQCTSTSNIKISDGLEGKPQKKVIFLMAEPLRGGGGGRAIKENRFLKIFFKNILLLFENKRYFTLDKSKYQYWQCWQSHSLLTGLLQYLAKHMVLLVQ